MSGRTYYFTGRHKRPYSLSIDHKANPQITLGYVDEGKSITAIMQILDSQPQYLIRTTVHHGAALMQQTFDYSKDCQHLHVTCKREFFDHNGRAFRDMTITSSEDIGPDLVMDFSLIIHASREADANPALKKFAENIGLFLMRSENQALRIVVYEELEKPPFKRLKKPPDISLAQ